MRPYEQNVQSFPLDIIGSSSFGRYSKISVSKTFNMMQSSSEEEKAMVPYLGYQVGIIRNNFDNATTARALFTSTKFDRLVGVFGKNVYLIDISYNKRFNKIDFSQVTKIGSLATAAGIVYVEENNKPQLLISDQQNLYLYDPTYTGAKFSFTVNVGVSTTILTFTGIGQFQIGDEVTLSTTGTLPSGLSASAIYYVSDDPGTDLANNKMVLAPTYLDSINDTNPVTFSTNGSPTNYIVERNAFTTLKTDFTPNNIVFHDTYFVVAATNDGSQGGTLNNTWRLSLQNDGTQFPSDAQHVGLLETKPDSTVAIARIPSGGNLIFVLGTNVAEPWFNEGAQLFPYQRNDQYNSDYGCVSAATVCYLDDIVVWLGRNKKSGPILMVSTGTLPEKITTDGLDFVFYDLQHPEDSQAFLFRKDGHLIYHINFYSDNQSYFYDFNTKKFYNACDENLNYYSIGQIAFFNNQYFGISKDAGELFVVDTLFYQYEMVDNSGNSTKVEIPRIRVCSEIRLPSQDYFILNDAGFTIESGETDYFQQDHGPIYLKTMDGNQLVTTGGFIYLTTMDGNFLTTMDGNLLVGTQADNTVDNLIAVQRDIVNVTPCVDMSVSYDSGATFGNEVRYQLFHVGKRINKLQWWQLGMTNNAVFMFKFWNIGRVVILNGEVNLRT